MSLAGLSLGQDYDTLLRRGEAFVPPFEPYRSTHQSETNDFRTIPSLIGNIVGIRLSCDPSRNAGAEEQAEDSLTTDRTFTSDDLRGSGGEAVVRGMSVE